MQIIALAVGALALAAAVALGGAYLTLDWIGGVDLTLREAAGVAAFGTLVRLFALADTRASLKDRQGA